MLSEAVALAVAVAVAVKLAVAVVGAEQHVAAAVGPNVTLGTLTVFRLSAVGRGGGGSAGIGGGSGG